MAVTRRDYSETNLLLVQIVVELTVEGTHGDYERRLDSDDGHAEVGGSLPFHKIDKGLLDVGICDGIFEDRKLIHSSN
jgi:hypothetical protein